MIKMTAVFVAFALGLTAAGSAQAEMPAAPVAAPAAKYTLDTPIETLVADPRAKTVLDTNLPGLTTNDRYDSFKGMSLGALAGFAPDKLTPDRLDKVKSELASLK